MDNDNAAKFRKPAAMMAAVAVSMSALFAGTAVAAADPFGDDDGGGSSFSGGDDGGSVPEAPSGGGVEEPSGGGLHEEPGGYAFNRPAIEGLADLARAAGARIIEGIAVTELVTDA